MRNIMQTQQMASQWRSADVDEGQVQTMIRGMLSDKEFNKMKEMEMQLAMMEVQAAHAQGKDIKGSNIKLPGGAMLGNPLPQEMVQLGRAGERGSTGGPAGMMGRIF